MKEGLLRLDLSDLLRCIGVLCALQKYLSVLWELPDMVITNKKYLAPHIFRMNNFAVHKLKLPGRNDN